jgi:putative oxidoreductase
MVRIAVGLLFLEHGLSTAFGFVTGRADHDFAKLHAWAGPVETIGGTLLILGLFTRATAFFLSGEMAVAYFSSRLRWETPGIVFWPIRNNGEEAVLNCFFFLWLVTAGGGAWSLDALIAKRRRKSDAAVSAIREPVRT